MQTRVSKAFADRHAVVVRKAGMIAHHFGQAIEWDTAIQVVHVMDADIATQPLKNGGHDIVVNLLSMPMVC